MPVVGMSPAVSCRSGLHWQVSAVPTFFCTGSSTAPNLATSSVRRIEHGSIPPSGLLGSALLGSAGSVTEVAAGELGPGSASGVPPSLSEQADSEKAATTANGSAAARNERTGCAPTL